MNKYIDHTGLKINTGIRQLCAEAEEYKFRGICIFPNQIKLARKVFNGKISTVIDFPYGASGCDTKVCCALDAALDGADELDVVMNIIAFKNKKYLKVVEELTRVVNVGIPVKVIVEEYYLNPDEFIIAHSVVKDSGAFCIKTSTGTTGRATLTSVELWKKLGDLKIKAAGGIRTAFQCKQFIAVGANIIGTSYGVQIMNEGKEHLDLGVNI